MLLCVCRRFTSVLCQCVFLVLGLLLSTCYSVALAQFVAMPEPPQTVYVENEDDESTQSAAEFVAELRRREPLEQLGLDQPVLIWPESLGLHTAEAYSSQPMRYLACRLMIANTTEAEVVFDPAKINLRTGGQTLVSGTLPQRFPEYYIELDDEMLDVEQVRKQKPLAVAAGTTRHLNVLFAEVPAFPSDVDLTLEFDLGKEARELDLRAFSAARLKLVGLRLGPTGVLGWLRIDGSLDTLNCTLLADQLASWSQLGVERFVISWGADAALFDEVLLDWLVETVDEDDEPNPLFVHLPRLGIPRELYLSQLPNMNRTPGDDSLLSTETANGLTVFEYNGSYYGEMLTPQLELAVTRALRTAYEVASPAVIHDELLAGHRLSVIALLRSVPGQLVAADLGRVLELSQSEDLLLRYAALEALGQFDAPAALAAIEAGLDSEQIDVRRAAVISTLRSPHMNIQQLTARILAKTSIPSLELVPLLVRFPHPLGSEYVAQMLGSENPKLRERALRALTVLGHPQLVSLLERGLQDQDNAVQSVAFYLLSQRTDRQSERSSLTYAIERLRQQKFDNVLTEFLVRLRDPRVAPLLLSLLETAPAESHTEIIGLLGTLGDDQTAAKLAEQFSSYDVDDQSAILEALHQQRAPQANALALSCLKHEGESIRQVALRILVLEGRPENEAALVSLLESLQALDQPPNTAEVGMLVDAIAQLNGSRSKAVLAAFRDHCYSKGYKDSLKATLAALEMQIQFSPAWNAVQRGLYFWRQDETEEALKSYLLAVQIDPELGFAQSQLANIYLRKEDLKAAKQHFQRAYDLDPFDGQAVTGLGILRAREGEAEAAVAFTLESADKFDEDDVFFYNTACVYGRAVEYLRTQPTSPERDRLIAEYTGAALIEIGRSIDFGFDQLDLIKEDPDLHALRDAPEFDLLVKRVQLAQ